jgi:DNA-binding CsgD family transcriptional regulator
LIIRESEDSLYHYGILRRSGRYPWGSGGNYGNAPGYTKNDPSGEVARSSAFLSSVAKLKAQGLDAKTIAAGYGMTTTQLRDTTTIANAIYKQDRINQITHLRDTKGMSTTAIGEKLGMSESTVRGLLASGVKAKSEALLALANELRRKVDEVGAIDIGVGVSNHLDVAATRLRSVVAILKEEGYLNYNIQDNQIGGAGTNKTTINVLARPDVDYKTLKQNPHLLGTINQWSGDGGSKILPIQPPINVGLNRVKVNYGDKGGAELDGTIYIRPGVKDLHMGDKRYAQVRIMVNGTHYLKGMAVYKDDLPSGVDIQFNTNKNQDPSLGVAAAKLKTMKPLKRVGTTTDANGNVVDDPNTPVDLKNPFGAFVKQLPMRDKNGVDIDGTVSSALNIVNMEGGWGTWKKSLSTQVLSKQPPGLAQQQLALTREQRQKQLAEIKALTNPVVKKKLLETFADETDSAAVDLKAANLPGQASHVILPVNSLKRTEVYAPNYPNGTPVALIRFPHGGTFEIPELTVNNNNREAKGLIGRAPDAVGIHHKVAERLSGADFDGDTVLVIPQTGPLKIKSTPAIKSLENFNPQERYKLPPGVAYKSHKASAMGDVSNLITDMTIKGADFGKIAQAVKHSMVVIDAEKHKLNWKQSEIDHGIAALKAEFQDGSGRGAATLISRAGGTARINQIRPRKVSDIPYAKKLQSDGQSVEQIAKKMQLTEDSVRTLLKPGARGGPVDPATGAKVFLETGATYVKRTENSKGVVKETVENYTTSGKKLALTDDARTLLSSKGGTAVERIYADHSNALKAMANDARKASLETTVVKMNPSARKAYAKEVAELDAQLNLVNRNKPLQRQALHLANARVAEYRAANPHMDKKAIQKLERLALAEAQKRTGATKTEVEITPEQWKAIQANAISPKKLADILNATNIDKVKEYATPRTQTTVTDAMLRRAKQMQANGYTQAEIAAQIGVKLGTLKDAIY